MTEIRYAKMCNLPIGVATKVFEMINLGYVKIEMPGFLIVTDKEPDTLMYPEGWYYSFGVFRNEDRRVGFEKTHQEAEMKTSKGEDWGNLAFYSTKGMKPKLI